MSNAADAISDSRAHWAAAITAAWRGTVLGIIDTGRLIAEAKADLVHGQFIAMVENDLPFDPRTAQMLMRVAADDRLTNAKHVSYLPPHWGTLYELTKLDDQAFAARLADGTIRADMQRKDIAIIVKRERRTEREAELAGKVLALPERKYGVILADPEWRFEPYSRETGMAYAADNHYPTSELDAIKARDVPSIAADDCALFLWATVPMLPQALEVMAAWGFAYKSGFAWIKDKAGTGYWNRNQHELLLLGTRGSIPAPALGTQWSSVIQAPRGEHSAKPEESYRIIIESYFPTLPKIELNRRGPPRPGWDSWGNEVPALPSADSAPDESSGEFRYVRHHDVERFMAEGWQLLPALQGTHHGAYSCLMRKGT